MAALAGTATGILDGSTLSNVATIGLLSNGGSIKKVVMQGHASRVVIKGENGNEHLFSA